MNRWLWWYLGMDRLRTAMLKPFCVFLLSVAQTDESHLLLLFVRPFGTANLVHRNETAHHFFIPSDKGCCGQRFPFKNFCHSSHGINLCCFSVSLLHSPIEHLITPLIPPFTAVKWTFCLTQFVWHSTCSISNVRLYISACSAGTGRVERRCSGTEATRASGYYSPRRC